MNPTDNWDIAWNSAMRNLDCQRDYLDLVTWNKGASILDIGCGPGVHIEYFLNKGLNPVGLDRNISNFRFRDRADIFSDFSELNGKQFDYVFASHVLEHCPNTFETIAEWKKFLKPNGLLIIFVPPFFDEVSNDHWVTGWNVGQLSMTLVAAGFNCRNSHFAQSESQVFGYGIRDDSIKAGFIIDTNIAYLPVPIIKGLVEFSEHQNLRGDISFLSPDEIEFLSRPTRKMSISTTDDWLVLDLKAGQADIAVSSPPELERGVDYILAVEAIGGDAQVRLCLAEGSSSDPYANVLDLWDDYPPGLSMRKFQLVDMTARGGRLDPAKLSQVFFGGALKRPAAHQIRFALFGPDGNKLI